MLCMKQKTIPIMVRVRPEAKRLLLVAAADQRRTQASIVDELILDNLGRRYASTDQRLASLLSRRLDE